MEKRCSGSSNNLMAGEGGLLTSDGVAERHVVFVGGTRAGRPGEVEGTKETPVKKILVGTRHGGSVSTAR